MTTITKSQVTEPFHHGGRPVSLTWPESRETRLQRRPGTLEMSRQRHTPTSTKECTCPAPERSPSPSAPSPPARSSRPVSRAWPSPTTARHPPPAARPRPPADAGPGMRGPTACAATASRGQAACTACAAARWARPCTANSSSRPRRHHLDRASDPVAPSPRSSDTSITVKAEDGYTATFAVTETPWCAPGSRAGTRTARAHGPVDLRRLRRRRRPCPRHRQRGRSHGRARARPDGRAGRCPGGRARAAQGRTGRRGRLRRRPARRSPASRPAGGWPTPQRSRRAPPRWSVAQWTWATDGGFTKPRWTQWSSSACRWS